MGDTRLGFCDMDSRVVAEESGKLTALLGNRTYLYFWPRFCFNALAALARFDIYRGISRHSSMFMPVLAIVK